MTPSLHDYRFVQVDVFTDQVFGGNPLAVFFDGAGLSDAEMQAIAREMNLSETVFLLPSSSPECAARARIFTPARELPFAGHPTIGTAWVMAAHGLLPSGTRRTALEEGIGPVPVHFDGDPAAPSFVWMAHTEATFGSELPDRIAVAHALSLNEGDLHAAAPVQTVSTGNPFLFVPLRDRATVDRVAFNMAEAVALMRTGSLVGVYVVAPEPEEGRAYGRMFAGHTSGVPEDPATGSAAGPLGAYLLQYGLAHPNGDGRVQLVVEQGTKMGRPSFLHVHLCADGRNAREIAVGGGVVPVLEGVLRLP